MFWAVCIYFYNSTFNVFFFSILDDWNKFVLWIIGIVCPELFLIFWTTFFHLRYLHAPCCGCCYIVLVLWLPKWFENRCSGFLEVKVNKFLNRVNEKLFESVFPSYQYAGTQPFLKKNSKCLKISTNIWKLL